MFSKWSRASHVFCAVLLSITLIAGAGCGLKTGDNEPTKNSDLGDSKFSCLAEITGNVDLYLSGNMSGEYLNQFMTCVKNALRDFEFYSKGKDEAGYAPEELAEFLNRHYLSNNPIEPGFLKELMRIKVMIMGGNEIFITHAEFSRMLECLDQVRIEANRHLPFIKLYGLHSTTRNEQFNATRQTVRDAAMALQATAEAFSERIITSDASYSMDSLERLIREVRAFIKWDQTRPEAMDANDVRNVIASFKEVMLGTTPDAILPSDWKPLFKTSARLFGLYIESQTLMRRPSLFEGEGLSSTIEFVENLFTTVEDTLNSQTNHIITFQSLDQLVDALGKIQMLPWNAKALSVKPVVHLLIEKILRNPDQPANGNAAGFTLSAFQEARKEFYIWADSQKYISQLAVMKLQSRIGIGAFNVLKSQQKPGSTWTGLADEHLREPLQSVDLAEYFTGTNMNVDARVAHIQYIVRNVRPMFREQDARVWLVPRKDLARYNIKLGLSNLSRLNIFGSLVRLLVRGYATPDRVKSIIANKDGSPDEIYRYAGVTQDKLEEFYQTMRPLGADLKFLDPRSQHVGNRSFGEGNMFTFSGNGIQLPSKDPKDTAHLLTFTEGLELITFIWSGGNVRTRFYNNTSKSCGVANNPLDIFGNRKIDRACFFRQFGQNQFGEVSNLPYMQNYLSRLNPTAKKAFFEGLTEIAKIPCEDARYIEMAEIATISTILHYVEVLFTVYDANRDGLFNGQEVLASFPRFNIFLGQKVKALKKKDYNVATLKGIFVLLVKNGKIPDSIGDQFDIFWKDLWYFDNDPYQFSRGAPIDRDPQPAEVLAEAAAAIKLKQQKAADLAQFGSNQAEKLLHNFETRSGIPIDILRMENTEGPYKETSLIDKAPKLSVDRYQILRVLVMLNKTNAQPPVCH